MRNIVDQTFVRESNLSSVLRYLHNQAPLSRAQLAQLIGLNKSTISSLVEELIDRELIHEIGLNSLGIGRPATMLELNPEAGYIVGVEFGVDFVTVGLTNFTGQITWRRMENADPAVAQETTIEQALRLSNEAIETACQQNMRLLGLGLAMPGMVDLKEGTLVLAPNLSWRDVPVQKIFSEHTGLKVFVDNDANAAALGEHLFGVARQTTDFIFIFAGIGIGGGLFLNGELYRGKNGFAGEIGHSPILSVSPLSSLRYDKVSRWETYAGQSSIFQRMKTHLETKRDGILVKLMDEQKSSLSLSVIAQAADAGDIEALEAFNETGIALGLEIASLVNIFNPEKVILGGPLSVAGKYLLPAIIEGVKQHSLPNINQRTEIVLSAFGPDASVIGAISMVVDYIFSHPSHVVSHTRSTTSRKMISNKDEQDDGISGER